MNSPSRQDLHAEVRVRAGMIFRLCLEMPMWFRQAVGVGDADVILAGRVVHQVFV
jgi:hypothetical protein